MRRNEGDFTKPYNFEPPYNWDDLQILQQMNADAKKGGKSRRRRHRRRDHH